MEKFSSLEDLLRIPGYNGSVILDISVLSCGCLTSESTFNELNIARICPTCQLQNVSILAPVKPLRDLYNIISNQQSQTSLKDDVHLPPRKVSRPYWMKIINLKQEMKQLGILNQ